MRSREETVMKAKELLNEQVADKVSWSEADRRGRIEEGQTRPTRPTNDHDHKIRAA
jgi:hypothetical protein